MDEKERIREHVTKITDIAQEITRDITIMEICGGHTNVIMKYGIREILPGNIRLISGPGCPVCVSSQYDIDCVIELARCGIPIATYGDMLRVPGSKSSLDDIRARGGKIFEIYSTSEVLTLQEEYPDIVFFGIGFETTAPMTTYLLERGVNCYSVHKLVPPALQILASGDENIDGFLDPGHVSTIIGVTPYRHIHIPQVIAGFTAERVLRAIRILVELIRDNKAVVINGYPEAVREEGNRNACALLQEHFYVTDCEWRGLGVLPGSGLEVKNDELNAKIRHRSILDTVPIPGKTACRCGEILKGLIEPAACSLYRKACMPETPQGACMVSSEGSCAISIMYGK